MQSNRVGSGVAQEPWEKPELDLGLVPSTQEQLASFGKTPTCSAQLLQSPIPGTCLLPLLMLSMQALDGGLVLWGALW